MDIKIMRVKGNCPKGGSKPWIDDDGIIHACRLVRYIYTAQEIGAEVLKFDDTEIYIKKEMK